ncbi:hypothetical protein FRC01_003149 [Tulasnella sp. 417]|nr:hypothetical protein FRC01_003149 [Tulasnella sp. 417]
MYTTFEWLRHKFNARDEPFAVPRNVLELLLNSDPLALPPNEPADGDWSRVLGFKNIVWHQFRIFADWFKNHSKRSAQVEERLQLIALKRVLCTSEDPNALVHAATNSRSIGDPGLIKQMVLDDDEFYRRLEHLSLVSGPGHIFDGHHSIQGWAMITSWFSLVVSAGSVEDFFDPDTRASLEKDTSEEAYASRLITRLSRKLGFLQFVYFNSQYPVECPDLNDPHYAAVKRCTLVVAMTTSTDLLDAVESNYDGREEPLALLQDSTSWGYAWLEAWTIQLSKDCDLLKMVQIICDAIATSAFQWDKRPHHGIYVALFERAIDIMSDYFAASPTLPLKAFITLLRAIENRIRHSATSIEEKQSERQYRKTCTEKLNTVVRQAYLPTGKVQARLGTDMALIEVTDIYGPLWFHCIEASDSLRDHLQWIKDTIQSDPSSPENPLLMTLSRSLRERLPLPDEVESGYQEDPNEFKQGWKEKSKVQSYRPFYSAFEGTMAEIESILATAGPLPMQDVLPREEKTTRTDPEWWGN